jgi:hypothetical protein
LFCVMYYALKEYLNNWYTLVWLIQSLINS